MESLLVADGKSTFADGRNIVADGRNMVADGRSMIADGRYIEQLQFFERDGPKYLDEQIFSKIRDFNRIQRVQNTRSTY